MPRIGCEAPGNPSRHSLTQPPASPAPSRRTPTARLTRRPTTQAPTRRRSTCTVDPPQPGWRPCSPSSRSARPPYPRRLVGADGGGAATTPEVRPPQRPVRRRHPERVLRQGRLRGAARAAQRHRHGPGRPAVDAGARPGDRRHHGVQEGRPVQGLLLERRREQPMARRRLQDDAGRGRSCTRRSPSSSTSTPTVTTRSRSPTSTRPARQRQLQRAHRLPEHDRRADAGRREGLRVQACRSSSSTAASTRDCPVTFIHPIGGYAFGADAAEFLVSKVPAGRQRPRAADPARASTSSRPAGSAAEGHLRRRRGQRRRCRVHRAAMRPRRSRS